MTRFDVPDDWTTITTIDAHTGGEPLRVVTGGYPEVPGATMLAKRRHAREHLDHLRRALMWEPRGHADMYGCVLTAPVTPDGDVGVLFLHNEGYSTMCGHGIIALVVVGIETGRLAPAADGAIRIDTPAGRVTARAELAGGRVARVAFRNVASFVVAGDLVVDVPGAGPVAVTLAFGGAFYGYVEAAAFGLQIEPHNAGRFVDLGMRIKGAVEAAHPPVHPAGEPELDFVYGTIFTQPGRDGVHSRNVCVFADGEVDRCPTGTGVSGRAAILHARGELPLGVPIVIESVLGTAFEVTVVEVGTVGPHAAVVPEVRGAAHLTGRHEFWIDPDDPLRAGFLLR